MSTHSHPDMFGAHADIPKRWWIVYPGDDCRRDFVHRVRARTEKGALAVVRQEFKVGRGAWAKAISKEERALDVHLALKGIGGGVAPEPTGPIQSWMLG